MVRGGYAYSNWGNLINARYAEESPLDIQLGGRFSTSHRNGSLNMTIYAEGDIRWEGLKVRVALTEDSVYYQAPNGTIYHNFTMRDMIPTDNGTPLDISQGETEIMSFDFSCDQQLDWHRCKLVAWVQSDITEREILQTAVIDLSDLEITSIDDPTALPELTGLAQNYPNPFNANTAIEYLLRAPGRVQLSIYNLLGGQVAELVNEVQRPGTYRIIWDGRDDEGDEVAGGVYFYRLVTEDNTINKRMIYLK